MRSQKKARETVLFSCIFITKPLLFFFFFFLRIIITWTDGNVGNGTEDGGLNSSPGHFKKRRWQRVSDEQAKTTRAAVAGQTLVGARRQRRLGWLIGTRTAADRGPGGGTLTGALVTQLVRRRPVWRRWRRRQLHAARAETAVAAAERYLSRLRAGSSEIKKQRT